MDASLFDLIGCGQHNKVFTAIIEMIHTGVDNGFPESKLSELQAFIGAHTNNFRGSFSSGPAAKYRPSRLTLSPTQLLFVSAYEHILKNSAN